MHQSGQLRPGCGRAHAPGPPVAADDTGPVGDDGGLDAVGGAELGEDRADVVLDGAGAQVEAVGDLGVGEALAEQGEHVELAGGEAAGEGGGVRVGAAAVDVAADHGAGDGRERTLPPAASTRTACTSWSGAVSLSRNPAAPARSGGADVLVGVEGGQHRHRGRVGQGAQLCAAR